VVKCVPYGKHNCINMQFGYFHTTYSIEDAQINRSWQWPVINTQPDHSKSVHCIWYFTMRCKESNRRTYCIYIIRRDVCRL